VSDGVSDSDAAGRVRRVAATEPCERCGSPRPAGRVAWCPPCLELLAGLPTSSPLRLEYRRDYQRTYQRSRRAGDGPARPSWLATPEGHLVRVALRRRDSTLVLTGSSAGAGAARRLAEAIGAPAAGHSETGRGGGRGGRRQRRFRIEAPLREGVGLAEVERFLRASGAAREGDAE
jgi:hypothetical protein